MRHASGIAWMGIALWLLVGAPAAGVEEPWSYGLAHELMSPYCPGRSLADCPSPEAGELRDWIAAQEKAGLTRAEVEARLYEDFGDVILARPRPQGFGATAYAIPILAFLGGGILVAVFMQRQARRAPAPDVRPPLSAVDSELERQVDEELRQGG